MASAHVVAHILKIPVSGIKKHVFPECALITDPKNPDVYHLNYRVVKGGNNFILYTTYFEKIQPDIYEKWGSKIICHSHYDGEILEDALKEIENSHEILVKHWIKTDYLWTPVEFGDQAF